jgi:hypothetical protein
MILKLNYKEAQELLLKALVEKYPEHREKLLSSECELLNLVWHDDGPPTCGPQLGVEVWFPNTKKGRS